MFIEKFVVIRIIYIRPMIIDPKIESLSSFPDVDQSAKSTFNTIYNIGSSAIQILMTMCIVIFGG